jgi:hypothetical protein
MTERRRRRHRAPRTRVGIGVLSTASFASLVGALAFAPHHVKASAFDTVPTNPSPANAAPFGTTDTTPPAPRPVVVIEPHRVENLGNSFDAPRAAPPSTAPLPTTPPTHGRTHGSR